MQENKRKETQRGQKEVWTAKNGEVGIANLNV